MTCVLSGVVLVVLLGASSAAQHDGRAPSAAATFRSSTELVALSVTVTDARGQHVPDLSASDFVVLEDGVEQPVSFFGVSQVPLDLTLLLDASSSMVDKIDIAREAVRGLTRRLRAGDRAALVEFQDRVVHRQGMTEDRQAIERALGEVAPRGDTALYTALYVALSGDRAAAAGQPGLSGIRRQAVVVLSDGQDTTSLIGYEDVLDKARRRGVTVYTVSLRPSEASVAARRRMGDGRALAEADFAMRQLAQETGGRAFFPSDPGELQAIYQGIGTELGQQYALGYVPKNGSRDGAWRRVQVRLTTRPGVRLRTRSGYFAEPGMNGLSAAVRALPSR